MSRLALILPTGTYRASPFLAAAARRDIDVVVASERPQALAGQMGDRFLEVPLAEPEEAARRLVEHARSLRLDGIVAVDDEGLLPAAIAAAVLGLRHSPPGAVRLTRDKAAMRAAFARAGVPQPAFAVVEPSSPEAVAAAAEVVGTPVVIKPCSLSASRGVIRADNPEGAAAAARRIAPILEEAGERRDGPLLVEAYVPGGEVAVEGILSAGALEVITVFDKPDPLEGPYFEETIYLAPSELATSTLATVIAETAAAVHALGLSEGPVHAELRLPPSGEAYPGGVALLEVAARTIGGRCSTAFRLADGSSLEELVVCRAAGVASPRAALGQPSGVLMIPIPRAGRLVAVHGLEETRRIPGVTGVEVTVPVGRYLRPLPEADRYLGFVFASGTVRGDVESALRRAKRTVDVEISPDTSAVTVAG